MKTSISNPASPEPTKILLGVHSVTQLVDMIRQHGSHVLLVHGHRPVEDGLLEKVRKILYDANIPYSNMGQILPNPKYDSVLRGIEIAKKDGCDLIISLGGGSTLQCAKGIAYGLYRKKKKHLWDLWSGKEKPKGMIPVGAVLTNPASGEELGDGCTLVKDGKQKTLTSPYGVCQFAILDPELSMLPNFPTQCQCFEIFNSLLCQSMECSSNEDEMHGSVMRMLMDASLQLADDQNNIDARNTLFACGLYSHALHLHTRNSDKSLASRLAFAHSMTEGEAQAALFFGWASTLDEQQKESVAQIGQTIFDLEKPDFDKTIKEIHSMVEGMHLADSIPDAGLKLTDKQMKKLAKTKKDLQILEFSNSQPVQEADKSKAAPDKAKKTDTKDGTPSK